MSFIHTQGITIKEAFKEMFQAIEDKETVEIVGILSKKEIIKLKKDANNKNIAENKIKRVENKTKVRKRPKRRVCKKCKKDRRIRFFSFNIESKDGYYKICSSCR